MRNAIRKHHITVNRIYRSDGIETSMRLVREGKGLALGPSSFASHFQLAAIPLEPETWVSLQFICLQTNLKRNEIRRFRDYLAELCKEREEK